MARSGTAGDEVLGGEKEDDTEKHRRNREGMREEEKWDFGNKKGVNMKGWRMVEKREQQSGRLIDAQPPQNIHHVNRGPNNIQTNAPTPTALIQLSPPLSLWALIF